MQDMLADKDEIAVEAVKITLDTVDICLKTLLEQIQIEVAKFPRASGIDGIGRDLGALVRLNVQKETIEQLRIALPKAILEGETRPLATIINVY